MPGSELPGLIIIIIIVTVIVICAERVGRQSQIGRRTFLALQLWPARQNRAQEEEGDRFRRTKVMPAGPGEASSDTRRKGKRVALGLWPPQEGCVLPFEGSQDLACSLAAGSCRLAAGSRVVGSRPWGPGPREPLLVPNCFVYEALLRASSGFPNELVCGGTSAGGWQSHQKWGLRL